MTEHKVTDQNSKKGMINLKQVFEKNVVKLKRKLPGDNAFNTTSQNFSDRATSKGNSNPAMLEPEVCINI